MDVRVLGPVEIRRDGVPVDVGSPKQRTVLALLAAAAPRLVSVDRLVEEVWEGSPPPRPLGSLQAYVSNLRRVLEPARRPGSPATVLVTAPPGYALRLDDELDRIRFERAAARGHDLLAAGEAAAARGVLAEALDMWRSERPYADVPVSALEPEAARLVELRSLATEDLWAAEIALGRHSAAVPELRRLATGNPLRERLWELLVVALYRSGHQAEALDVLREVRRHLAGELGIDPGPALRTLEADVLRQAPHLDPPAVTAATVSRQAVPWGGAGGPDVLIGRDDAMAALAAAAAAAQAGRGAIVLVTGEPGIGKSRLLREFAATAPGMRTVTVTGDAEGQPPWHGWSTVLEQLGAPMPEPAEADPDRARWRMIQAVRSALTEAAAGPLAVVFDDLQWIDSATLQVLTAVIDTVPGQRLCVVAAVRDTPPDDGPLATALAALARAGALRIDLHRLDLDETRRYVRSVVGRELPHDAVTALHERTGGNPLFLRETVRLLTEPGGVAPMAADEVPAGVRDLVRLRVAALPDDARTVLSVAAVLGRQIDVDLLGRVCGLDPERTLDLVDVAVVHRILEEDPAAPGRVRFGHALVRDAMLADLPPARRAALHLRTADELSAGGSAGRAASLAYHLERAAVRRPDVAGRAVAAAEQAAAEASRRGAPIEAARWRDRALRLAEADPALPDRRRHDLLVALAAARREASDVPGARQAMLDAVTIAEELADERLVAEALVAYGTATATIWPGPWPDPVVLERLRRSARRLDALGDALRCRLLSCLAAETARTGDTEATRAISEQAVAAARDAGDDRLLAQILGAHIITTWTPDTVARRIDEALELSALPAGPTAEAIGRWYAGVSMLEYGRRRAGRVHVDRSRRLAARLGLPGLLAQQGWYAATERLLDGDLAAAEAAMGEAAALHRRTGMWGGDESLASQLFTLRDEQNRLPELVDTLTAFAETGMPGVIEGAALALLRAGDLAGARAALARAFEEPPAPAWGLVHSWTVRAEVVAAVGTDAHAAEATRVLAPFAGRVAVAGTGVTCRGAVDRTLGLLAERRGDLRAAEDHLRAAMLLEDSGGLIAWAAHSRVALARVLRRVGGAADGEPHALLDQAARVADRGLPRLAEAVSTERGRG